MRRGTARASRVPAGTSAGSGDPDGDLEEALLQLHRCFRSQVLRPVLRPAPDDGDDAPHSAEAWSLTATRGGRQGTALAGADGDVQCEVLDVARLIKSGSDNHRLTGTWKEAYLNMTVKANPDKSIAWVLAPGADPSGADA